MSLMSSHPPSRTAAQYAGRSMRSGLITALPDPLKTSFSNTPSEQWSCSGSQSRVGTEGFPMADTSPRRKPHLHEDQLHPLYDLHHSTHRLLPVVLSISFSENPSIMPV